MEGVSEIEDILEVAKELFRHDCRVMRLMIYCKIKAIHGSSRS